MQDLGHNSELTAPAGRVIVLPEANSGLPRREDFERMARRRFQDPKPKRKGAWWWILSYKDEFVNGKIARKRKRLKVAPATMGEREAKKIASEMLRPMNQGLESIGSATQFGAYIETTYRDTVLPLLASSVQKTYALTLKKHLLPLFANMPLRDMNVITLQKYFSGMKANHPTALKIKDVLASVLGSAVRFGLLVRSPMSGVQLMAPKHGKRVKPHITPEQFDALVTLMVEPYATMVYVCVMAGLRVSELIGLKWEDVHMDSLTIDERYCRGDWAAPKTAASSATIGVSLKVIQRIQHSSRTHR
jgi:integrase